MGVGTWQHRERLDKVHRGFVLELLVCVATHSVLWFPVPERVLESRTMVFLFQFVVRCVRIVASGSELEDLKKDIQTKQWLLPGAIKVMKENTSRNKTIKQC